jgi:hypothetical protein
VAFLSSGWNDTMMTRIRARLGGLFFVSVALATGAGAQEAGGTVARRHGVTRAGLDSLRAAVGFRGRVRDTASSAWRIGTLGLVSEETIILRGRDDTRIPTQSLVTAQRSTGRATFNPSVVGFVVGMLAGGGAGVAIGNQTRSASEPNGPQRSVGLAIGAAVGAGLGVLVGRAFAPEHWRDIRLR